MFTRIQRRLADGLRVVKLVKSIRRLPANRSGLFLTAVGSLKLCYILGMLSAPFALTTLELIINNRYVSKKVSASMRSAISL